MERSVTPSRAGNLGGDGAERQSSGDGGLGQHVAKRSRAYLGTRGMVAHLRDVGTDSGLLEKIEGCGHYLRFRHYYEIGHWKLTEASFCKQHQVCHHCAFNRAARYGGNLARMAKSAMAADATLKPIALTLTIPNGPDCSERLQRLCEGVSKLLAKLRKGRSKATRHKSALAPCKAGFVALECTRNHLTGEWHWHAHALLLCADWIDQDDLRAEWSRCIGEDVAIPHLKHVKDGEKGLLKAVCETIKYSVKFSAMIPEQAKPKKGQLRPSDILTIYRASRGARLIRTFGLFRGHDLELEAEEFVDVTGQPFRDLLYRAIEGVGYALAEVSEPAIEGKVLKPGAADPPEKATPSQVEIAEEKARGRAPPKREGRAHEPAPRQLELPGVDTCYQVLPPRTYTLPSQRGEPPLG